MMVLAMLSSPLADEKAIEEFVRDKSDREIAITGLKTMNSHLVECAERWSKIYTMLKFIGVGIGVIIVDRITSDLHWDWLKRIFALATGT